MSASTYTLRSLYQVYNYSIYGDTCHLGVECTSAGAAIEDPSFCDVGCVAFIIVMSLIGFVLLILLVRCLWLSRQKFENVANLKVDESKFVAMKDDSKEKQEAQMSQVSSRVSPEQIKKGEEEQMKQQQHGQARKLVDPTTTPKSNDDGGATKQTQPSEPIINNPSSAAACGPSPNSTTTATATTAATKVTIDPNPTVATNNSAATPGVEETSKCQVCCDECCTSCGICCKECCTTCGIFCKTRVCTSDSDADEEMSATLKHAQELLAPQRRTILDYCVRFQFISSETLLAALEVARDYKRLKQIYLENVTRHQKENGTPQEELNKYIKDLTDHMNYLEDLLILSAMAKIVFEKMHGDVKDKQKLAFEQALQKQENGKLDATQLKEKYVYYILFEKSYEEKHLSERAKQCFSWKISQMDAEHLRLGKFGHLELKSFQTRIVEAAEHFDTLLAKFDISESAGNVPADVDGGSPVTDSIACLFCYIVALTEYDSHDRTTRACQLGLQPDQATNLEYLIEERVAQGDKDPNHIGRNEFAKLYEDVTGDKPNLAILHRLFLFDSDTIPVHRLVNAASQAPDSHNRSFVQYYTSSILLRTKYATRLAAYIPYLILFTAFMLFGIGYDEAYLMHLSIAQPFTTDKASGLPSVQYPQDCSPNCAAFYNSFFMAYHEIAFFADVKDWLSAVLVPNLWPDVNSPASSFRFNGVLPIGALKIRQVRSTPTDAADLRNAYFWSKNPDANDTQVINDWFRTNASSYPSLGLRHTPYESSSKSTADMGPRNDIYNDPAIDTRIKDAFRYRTASQLNSSDYYFGKTLRMEGDGFALIIPFSANGTYAKSLIDTLFSKDWVDMSTRAIMFEIFFYNSQLHIIHRLQLIIETPVGGLYVPLAYGDIAKLFNSGSHTFGFFIFLVVFFAYLFIYIIPVGLYEFLWSIPYEARLRRRELGLFSHLKAIASDSMANSGALILFLNSVVQLIAWIIRIIILQETTTKFGNDAFVADYLPASYDKIVSYARVSVYTSALAIAFAYLVPLFYLTYQNDGLAVVKRTVSRAVNPLLSLVVISVMMLAAFAVCAFIAYGAHLPDYRDPAYALAQVLLATIGEYDYDEWRAIHRTFSAVFFFLVTVLLEILLLNMVVSILMDAFDAEMDCLFDSDGVKLLMQNDVTVQLPVPSLLDRARANPFVNAFKTVGSKALVWFKASVKKFEDCVGRERDAKKRFVHPDFDLRNALEEIENHDHQIFWQAMNDAVEFIQFGSFPQSFAGQFHLCSTLVPLVNGDFDDLASVLLNKEQEKRHEEEEEEKKDNNNNNKKNDSNNITSPLKDDLDDSSDDEEEVVANAAQPITLKDRLKQDFGHVRTTLLLFQALPNFHLQIPSSVLLVDVLEARHRWGQEIEQFTVRKDIDKAMNPREACLALEDLIDQIDEAQLRKHHSKEERDAFNKTLTFVMNKKVLPLRKMKQVLLPVVSPKERKFLKEKLDEVMMLDDEVDGVSTEMFSKIWNQFRIGLPRHFDGKYIAKKVVPNSTTATVTTSTSLDPAQQQQPQQQQQSGDGSHGNLQTVSSRGNFPIQNSNMVVGAGKHALISEVLFPDDDSFRSKPSDFYDISEYAETDSKDHHIDPDADHVEKKEIKDGDETTYNYILAEGHKTWTTIRVMVGDQEAFKETKLTQPYLGRATINSFLDECVVSFGERRKQWLALRWTCHEVADFIGKVRSIEPFHNFEEVIVEEPDPIFYEDDDAVAAAASGSGVLNIPRADSTAAPPVVLPDLFLKGWKAAKGFPEDYQEPDEDAEDDILSNGPLVPKLARRALMGTTYEEFFAACTKSSRQSSTFFDLISVFMVRDSSLFFNTMAYLSFVILFTYFACSNRATAELVWFTEGGKESYATQIYVFQSLDGGIKSNTTGPNIYESQFNSLSDIQNWIQFVNQIVFVGAFAEPNTKTGRWVSQTNEETPVGAIVIRQVRRSKVSCVGELDALIPLEASTLALRSDLAGRIAALDPNCVDGGTEDQASFGNSTVLAGLDPLVQDAFKYRTCEQLGLSGSYYHEYGTIPCDGHALVVPLSKNQTEAQNLFKSLIDAGWIDEQTGVLAVNMVTFNLNLNFFLRWRFFVQITRGGEVVPVYDVNPVRPWIPNEYSGGYKFFLGVFFLTIILQGAATIRTIYLDYDREKSLGSKRLVAFGRALTDDMWWIINLSNVVILMVLWSWRFSTMYDDTDGIKIYKPQVQARIERLAELNIYFDLIEAFCAILTYFRIAYYLRSFPSLNQLARTLFISASEIWSLVVIFVIVFLGFGLSAFLIVGPVIFDFSTVELSLGVLFRGLLGADLNFAAMIELHPVWTGIFHTSFIIACEFVLFNLIIAVLNESLEKARSETVDVEPFIIAIVQDARSGNKLRYTRFNFLGPLSYVLGTIVTETKFFLKRCRNFTFGPCVEKETYTTWEIEGSRHPETFWEFFNFCSAAPNPLRAYVRWNDHLRNKIAGLSSLRAEAPSECTTSMPNLRGKKRKSRGVGGKNDDDDDDDDNDGATFKREQSLGVVEAAKITNVLVPKNFTNIVADFDIAESYFEKEDGEDESDEDIENGDCVKNVMRVRRVQEALQDRFGEEADRALNLALFADKVTKIPAIILLSQMMQRRHEFLLEREDFDGRNMERVVSLAQTVVRKLRLLGEVPTRTITVTVHGHGTNGGSQGITTTQLTFDNLDRIVMDFDATHLDRLIQQKDALDDAGGNNNNGGSTTNSALGANQSPNKTKSGTLKDLRLTHSVQDSCDLFWQGKLQTLGPRDFKEGIPCPPQSIKRYKINHTHQPFDLEAIYHSLLGADKDDGAVDPNAAATNNTSLVVADPNHAPDANASNSSFNARAPDGPTSPIKSSLKGTSSTNNNNTIDSTTKASVTFAGHQKPNAQPDGQS